MEAVQYILSRLPRSLVFMSFCRPYWVSCSRSFSSLHDGGLGTERLASSSTISLSTCSSVYNNNSIGGPFPSVGCNRASASCKRHVAPPSGGSLSSRRNLVEKLWRELFLDPSQWWDHRAEKVEPRYPDFKHKKTQQSLWLTDNSNPAWVEAELAAMTPGALQSNIFSWNKRLKKLVKAADYEKTLNLFQQMQRESIHPDKFTFLSVLNACSSLRALVEGKRIHLLIKQTGYESDRHVATCLVHMYAKCRSIGDARTVFNTMPRRDVVAWNAMILGYARCEEGQQALDLSFQMKLEGVDMDPVTFVALLNACASISALEEGRRVHKQIIERGYESNIIVGNSLVNMYSKCGSIEDAQRVFTRMPKKDVVTWNNMILGYAKCGEGQKALELSRQMESEGSDPNPVTFVGMLNACASLEALEEGRHVHEQVTARGHDSDIFVGSALVDMYCKCGSIEDGRRVFNKLHKRDVVAWGAMITGYVKCGEGQKALKLSQQMQCEGVNPNRVTLIGVVNACACAAALEEGRLVHKQVIERGFESDLFVGSSLVDMYAKCGCIEDAWTVFHKMPIRNVVAYNAMILGYVKCEEGQKALELFRQMQGDGVDPNPVTYLGVLNACTSIAAFEEGKYIHKQIIERGYEVDVFVASCLVDMYARCGDIEDARRMFHKMCTRSVVSWSVLLAGYARHGYAEEALGHFEQMCEVVEVDGVAFLSLLSACSHGGFVDEGLHYFQSMSQIFNVFPTGEHFACIIDLLGRAGRLHEAEDFISSMICEPSASVWMSLLGACRVHGNVGMGEHAAKQVLYLNPENASGYVLLSNIYAV